jgi:hypothetical protein
MTAELLVEQFAIRQADADGAFDALSNDLMDARIEGDAPPPTSQSGYDTLLVRSVDAGGREPDDGDSYSVRGGRRRLTDAARDRVGPRRSGPLELPPVLHELLPRECLVLVDRRTVKLLVVVGVR